MKLFGKKASLSVLLLGALIGMASCSNDDDPKPLEEPNWDTYDFSNVHEDQLRYFEGNLFSVDEDGNLEEHANGVPLPSLDPDPSVVFLGVENYAEAKDRFKSWLPEKADIKESADCIQFMPTDTLGVSQGIITLAPVQDESGISVATITFSSDCPIKNVSKVNFILNSAWPTNAVSPYALYEAVTFYEKDGPKKYICVKTASNGSNGILVSVTNEPALIGWGSSCEKSEAVAASNAMKGNWDTFAKVFAENGMPSLRDEPHHEYRIYHFTYVLFWCVAYIWDLKEGTQHAVSFTVQRRFLFVKYFGTVE